MGRRLETRRRGDVTARRSETLSREASSLWLAPIRAAAGARAVCQGPSAGPARARTATAVLVRGDRERHGDSSEVYHLNSLLSELDVLRACCETRHSHGVRVMRRKSPTVRDSLIPGYSNVRCAGRSPKVELAIWSAMTGPSARAHHRCEGLVSDLIDANLSGRQTLRASFLRG